MLTDIFANRYADVLLWENFGDNERRFLVQAYGIVKEQLFPTHAGGTKINGAEERWQDLHDRLATELGVNELSARAYAYTTVFNGNPRTVSGVHTIDSMCKTFVCADFDGSIPVDRFMKERLSFLEIAFRKREEAVQATNARLPMDVARAKAVALGRRLKLPGKREDGVREANRRINESFQAAADEFNTRLQQAGFALHYHNGFIQRSVDEKVEEQISEPFWLLLKDEKWKNVDTDMKEAIDRRDAGRRDPAFPAAKALESTIKIISTDKGWTHGKEKGAQNFIDNLGSKKNGRFIDGWERTALKEFFSSVRSQDAHGPGHETMPELSPQQTDLAIEFCMSWIKSLINRL